MTSTRPAWSRQAYVCCACRRQWQNAHQRRWNTQQLPGSSTSPVAADSWFDTLNDISDHYSSHHQPSPPKPAEKPDYGGAQRRREITGRRGRFNFRPKTSQARDLKSLAKSLVASVESAVAPSTESKEKNDAEFNIAFLTGQSRHSRDRRKRPEESSRVVVSDLLSELKAGAEASRVRQDEGFDLPQEPEEEHEEVKVVPEDTGPRPFPTFRGRQSRPIDSVHVPVRVGKTAADVAGKGPTKPKVWKAKTSPAESGLGGGHVESRVLFNQSMNLMDRFKETQARKPWGGASEERASSPPPKATFNTLAKADRVTPKKPIETSVAKKPFGVIDSLKQLWRGAPKDPMEGLRSRHLTTNEVDDSSTAGFSFGMTTTTKSPVQPAESKAPDTEPVDLQTSDEAKQSAARSSEQKIASAQEGDGAAVNSLTKLHASRSQHSEEGSSEQQKADAEGGAIEQADLSPMNASLPIGELDLVSALQMKRRLQTKLSKSNHRRLKQKAARARARIQALGADPEAQLSTSDELSNTNKAETADPEAPATSVLASLMQDHERLKARRAKSTDATLRKTLSRLMQYRRARIRALREAAQEVSSADTVMAADAAIASPATVALVEETDNAAVSQSISSDQANLLPGQEAADVAQPAADDSPADGRSGMSLADAMKQDTKPRASRRRSGARNVALDKAPLETATEVQQAAEEAQAAVEPESSTETEAVEEAEVEEQARVDVLSVQLSDLEVKPLDLPQPPVPHLEYGLDRVLFNTGIYQLQDAASRVYNFDPYLQKIMPVEQFDFNSLKEYKTSSQDTALAETAKQQDKRYIGSTSSMTSSLAHFHYLISNWRPLNLDMLSQGYFGPGTSSQFTNINKAPSAVFLRWKNGSYAIDVDKEYDSPNVLMLLGKSMELLLTSPKDEYEKYRKSDPRTVSEEQRTSPESYQYSTMGDFLMRSQLDACDPRLPGNGTFDLKTRAVVSVRMSSRDHEKMTGYEIYGDHGRWCSYEKEYHDMARSTMLKYMLQARMGRMNGIFVAYHNIKRIFGFQYIPISEMDRLLHGQTDPILGDQEFKASLKIMNDLLNKATAKYPEQSLRIHFEAQKSQGEDVPPYLHMFAEPMTEEEIDEIQNKNKERIAEYERNIMGKEAADASSTKAETSEKPASTNDNKSAASTENNDPANDDATAYARKQLLVHSSDSPADKPFLEKVETLQTTTLKPLFYATVLVQSQINGSVPADDRPRNLKSDDTWELNYLIKDYDVSSHEWALYQDMKARRKEALWFEEDGGDGDGDGLDRGEGKEKRENSFLTFLEELSRKGELVREKMDLADRESGREQNIVMVDDRRERERVESVEDYVGWLYSIGGRGNK